MHALDVEESSDALREHIPDELRDRLVRVIASDEAIRFSVSTDMKLDGTYGTDWLVATDRQLIRVSPDGVGPPDMQFIPLTDIASVEIRNLFNHHVLKVRMDDRALEVARFSKSLAYKFHQVSPEIETLVRERKPSEEVSSEEEQAERRPARAPGRCPQCGHAIPHRSGVCPRCMKKGKLLYRLLSYALPYWKLATVGLVIMLVATFIGLMPPLLMKMLIDDVLAPKDVQTLEGIRALILSIAPRASVELLSLLAGLFLLITLSTNGMRAFRGYLMAQLGQRITFDLRNQVYRHLHTLSLSFYSREETGRIMARVTHDVGRLQDFISEGLQEAIGSIFTIAIIAVILFRLNAGLAVLVMLPTPLLVVTTLFFSKKLHKVFHALWKRWAGMSAILADTIPGMRVVKAFAQEAREVRKFNRHSEQLLFGELRAARLRTMFGPIMSFITYLGTMIVWWVGGRKVLGEDLTLGGFTAFTGYMWQFYFPVETLCRLNHRFQHAATSAERVFEVLDTEPEIQDEPDAADLPEIEGRIRFDHVTFSYEEGQPVLKDVDFEVEPGEMIGLAGHSGAGKSTLINLLCRFYDVQEGAITVDGHDVRDVTMRSLRSQIGVVLQDPFLFNGTVAENIAYGKPEATMKEIIAAAKAANAHDFIMDFPEAYDTEVGERGAKLSGGERQRLAIARAILKDPRILILDEATSSVDTETEAQIQEALARLVKGRTTFAIAHRLSTLRNSNRLLILEKGKLAEIGTHNELIERDGIYAKLCRMQTELSRIRVW